MRALSIGAASWYGAFQELLRSQTDQTIMKKRTRAREVVLQLLFQRDVQPNVARDAIEELVHERLATEDLQQFCLQLYDGVVEHCADIDAQLGKSAENWKLSRMAVVDRNVLRIGGYEILFSDTPPKVALNEAIDLARRYGSEKSPGFVNGVLDRLLRDMQNHQNASPSSTE